MAARKKSSDTQSDSPPSSKPNLLEGIQFADEGESPEDEGTTPDDAPSAERTPASVAADQRAAKLAIEQMRQQHALKGPGQGDLGMPMVRPMSKEAEQVLKPKLYRVKTDRQIRRGAAQYLLWAGKVISANEYNIPDLEKQGVQLEPVAS